MRPMYDATRERPPLTVRQVFRDIREGLDYLVRHAGVRTFTIIGFLQCVGAGGFVALMVVWIDQRLGVGTAGLRFGLVFGVVGRRWAGSPRWPCPCSSAATPRRGSPWPRCRWPPRRPGRALRDDVVGGRADR